MAGFTIEQYNALNEAIAQGVTKVKYTDKEVEYRSLKEMMQLRGTMENELGLNNSKPRRILASHSKGL